MIRPGLTVPALLATAAFMTVGASAQTTSPSPADGSISALINGGIDALSARALPTLGAVAAVGVLTMAVQEALKELLRHHRTFNATQVRRWAEESKGVDGLRGLVDLATAGRFTAIEHAHALCDLDGPGLSAQLSLAAKLALAFPEQPSSEPVLRLVVGPVGEADLRLLTPPPSGAPHAHTQAPSAAAVDDARTRLAFLIDRTIDSLQITLTHEWARRNRLYAFALSALIATVAGLFYYWDRGILARPWSELGMHYATIFIGAVVSGVLAPVAKDLVTALQSLRGGR